MGCTDPKDFLKASVTMWIAAVADVWNGRRPDMTVFDKGHIATGQLQQAYVPLAVHVSLPAPPDLVAKHHYLHWKRTTGTSG
jgi:hypothetical protein